MNTDINSSKLCIIGENDMGGFTCKWMDATHSFDGNWFACATLEAAEAEAVRMGFVKVSNPAIKGPFGIRNL